MRVLRAALILFLEMLLFPLIAVVLIAVPIAIREGKVDSLIDYHVIYVFLLLPSEASAISTGLFHAFGRRYRNIFTYSGAGAAGAGLAWFYFILALGQESGSSVSFLYWAPSLVFGLLFGAVFQRAMWRFHA